MSLYSCLQNVIGFAPANCECIDDFTQEYAISDSGLYVTELQGMSLRILDSLGGCEDLWQKMTRARENAINAFRVDLAMAMTKYKEPIRGGFSGAIGGKYIGSKFIATDASNYYGLRMYSDIMAGTFTLTGVSLILNSTETVDLEIYDDFQLLTAIPVSSQANRVHFNDLNPPLQINLDGNYYFLIRPVGRAMRNRLTCGCGGYRWCFDLVNPCYTYSRDGWTHWAMIGGIQGDDVTEREDWPVGSQGMGLILHGTFGCDSLEWLCTGDFINNEVDRAVANAILYKTGEFLTTYIMGSTEVSRYTLLGVEQLNENRMYYAERYNVLLDWIAFSMEDNDCMKCKSPYGMRTRSQRI